MSSMANPQKRSKKTKRLGPVQVIQPEQYEAFDVNSKVECILNEGVALNLKTAVDTHVHA